MSVDRPEAMRWLADQLEDHLVVAGLGNPSYDLLDAADRPGNLYLWGGMGMAPSIGLGVALGAPHREVVAMEGDGGTLMNLGCLASIGALAPGNLTVIVWDNGGFELTGGQPTATTGGTTDLAAVARACGIPTVRDVDDLHGFELAWKDVTMAVGPRVLVVDTAATPPDLPRPRAALRRRFLRTEEFTDLAGGAAT